MYMYCIRIGLGMHHEYTFVRAQEKLQAQENLQAQEDFQSSIEYLCSALEFKAPFQINVSFFHHNIARAIYSKLMPAVMHMYN